MFNPQKSIAMRKLRMWMLAAILICGLTMVLTSCSDKGDNPVPVNPESENKAPDYSDKNCWLRQPEPTKDVDVFYVYPTEYNGRIAHFAG